MDEQTRIQGTPGQAGQQLVPRPEAPHPAKVDLKVGQQLEGEPHNVGAAQRCGEGRNGWGLQVAGSETAAGCKDAAGQQRPGKSAVAGWLPLTHSARSALALQSEG